MFSKLRTLVLAGAVVALVGCLETKQEVTLNPDGSGKVVYELKKPLDAMIDFKMGDTEEESPEDKAKKEVTSILKNSEGIDTWEDVSYMVDEDDNSLKFRGTAYFKSYNDAKIGGSVKSGKDSSIVIDDKGMTVAWKQVAQKMGMPGEKPKPKQPVKLSDAEVAKKVKKAQSQLKQTTVMMGPMMAGFRDEVIFHLPGKIDKVNNFKKVDDNTVSISIDGEKMLKVMQDFAKDKEAIAKTIKAGNDIQKDGPGEEYMTEKMFGNVKAIEAHASKLKPQFDYKKDMEKAKKNFPAMCKKLGVDVK